MTTSSTNQQSPDSGVGPRFVVLVAAPTDQPRMVDALAASGRLVYAAMPTVAAALRNSATADCPLVVAAPSPLPPGSVQALFEQLTAAGVAVVNPLAPPFYLEPWTSPASWTHGSRSQWMEVDVDVGAPAAGRTFAGRVLREWECQSALDDVCLVASELVSNAVRHSDAGALRLTLSACADMIGVSVHETGRGSRQTSRPTTDPGGRGMRIVAGLSTVWGADQSPAGATTVWAHLRVPRVRPPT